MKVYIETSSERTIDLLVMEDQAVARDSALAIHFIRALDKDKLLYRFEHVTIHDPEDFKDCPQIPVWSLDPDLVRVMEENL